MNKPRDSWWTVLIIDPLAVRLVPWVSRRSAVTPMRLTAAAFVLGLLSVAAFATGRYVPAALLFEASFLLDCLDGKLARHRGSSSQAGAFVDVAGDMLVVGLSYAALSASLIDAGEWQRYPLVLGVAVFASASWVQLYRRLQYGDDSRERTGAGQVRSDSWLGRRRLKAYPTAVEAEAAALFLAPLLLPDDGIVVVLLVAFAFYALSLADSSLRVYRRASASPGPS